MLLQFLSNRELNVYRNLVKEPVLKSLKLTII